ncbi:MAG: type II toxin-antitoxin system YafQ family toxin [Kiritimatiellia bacterium]
MLNHTHLKLAQRRNLDIERLKRIVCKLCIPEALPEANRDHELSGPWKNYRECHIQPDWLLIYFVDKKTGTVHFVRTGSHSDLFE